jgi:uncharacterized protein
VLREHAVLAGVPALLVARTDFRVAAARGCTVVFHGLGASKDAQLKELESLAGQGFLAVGVDNVGHGERRYPDFDRRLSQNNPEFSENFLRAVLETARETPRLLDALLRQGLAREDRIGALGISMGAFISYTAVTLEPRLRAVVALVGSPAWPLDLPASPHRQLERFDRVRLLSQTAGRDTVVPSRYARAFHGRLREIYGDYDVRFAYAEYPDSDHLLEADWDRLWERTLGWFHEHLV